MKKYIINSVMAAAALFGLAACQADMDAPALKEPVASMTPNTTLAEFKTAFADQTVLCPMKDEATNTPYIIHGRVISSDATGNIYKSIVIQDETAALAISVNQGSTYTDYRLGQEIVVNATGIYIGYYNGLQQLGWYDTYEGAPSLTFLPWSIFQGHTELNGFPNQDFKYVSQDPETWTEANPYTVVTTFSQLPTAGEEFRNMQSQLVEFRNVHFKEGGQLTYAPYQESVNRTLVDAGGQELTVRTSGYSNFYNELIPEGNGNVRGILSYYGDGWQLLLRSTYDVMIGNKGQKDDPYSVAEAIDAQDLGAFGWVEGYIVGTVAAGVQEVTDNSNIIWSDQAELPTNLVIAASADETDWTKCIVVDLPQGSAFRDDANMVDHPEVYKKHILVSGNLATLFGMPGITDNGGKASDVEIDGITIGNGSSTPGEGIADGNGTEGAPYSAAQIHAMTTENGVNLYTNAWVSGYIVGYVDTGIKTFASAESCKIGEVPATVATNLLLANTPDETDWNNCISVNLPSGSEARTALNLKDNPGNLKKLVSLLGNVTRYVGISGVKEVSSYKLSDGGDTPTPPTPGGSGDGSEASPYTAGQINAMTVENSVNLYTGVWGAGYIVGYVNTGIKSYACDESCVIGTVPAAVATNLLLADSPTETDWNKCMSVNLPSGSEARTALNLKDNSGNLGKYVQIYGNVTKYVGIAGMKEISKYKLDGSSTPDPTPSIYASLTSDATGWTFDNISMGEGITYVWHWDAQYKNLKGNAFNLETSSAVAAESIAVSPEISLAGYTKAEFTFDHAAKFQTILKTSCYPVIREAGQTSWTKLEVTTWPAPGAWTFVNAGSYDISAYAGKTVQIGFHYGSSAAEADTWEIKNFKVTGTK